MAKDTTQSVGAAKPRRALLGKKVGMTQAYSDGGELVPVTVIRAGPCTVLQVKTLDTDGYSAVQLGFDDTHKPRRWPQQAHLEKIGVTPKRFIKEIPLADPKAFVEPGGKQAAEGEPGAAGAGEEEAARDKAGDGPSPGATLGVGIFQGVKSVNVRGVTKGRGFAGVIRRYGFNAGPKSHGTKNIREPGSTGMHTDPGRVHRGKKMPGHMGAVRRKARNLAVFRIDEGENLLIVKGSIPGPNGGYVYIEESLR
jgi:large subunit ribosomal protein L3